MKLKDIEKNYGDKYWGQSVLKLAKKNISRGIKEELAVQFAFEDLLDQHEDMMKSMGMGGEYEEEGPESEMED